jgi:hypothetical protein
MRNAHISPVSNENEYERRILVLSLRIFENLEVQSHQKSREKVLGSSYRLLS